MTLKPAHLSYKCTVCTATFNMYRLFENHVYSAHSVVNKNKGEGGKKGGGKYLVLLREIQVWWEEFEIWVCGVIEHLLERFEAFDSGAKACSKCWLWEGDVIKKNVQSVDCRKLEGTSTTV